MKDENLRLRDHDPEELSFYSKATTDFEFLFPFGWGELWGVADRTDYDLNASTRNTSGKDLTYFDQETNEHYIPYRHRALPGRRPRDPGLPGATPTTRRSWARTRTARTTSAWSCACTRLWPPSSAPCCPSPRSWPARPGDAVTTCPRTSWWTTTTTGSIGKRYRRQDEIGTPFCITVDFDTVGDGQEPRRPLRHRPGPRHHGAGADLPIC